MAQDDHGDGDIGAVVGHTLAAGDDVVEDQTLVDGADLFLQAVNMVDLHGVAEVVDDLLQGLDLFRQGQVVFGEGIGREGRDPVDGGGHDLQLVAGVTGEGAELGVRLLGTDGDDQGLVGDQLKVGDGVQIFGDVLVLLERHLAAGQLDQVGAERVLIVVDDLFKLADFFGVVVVQMADHIQGQVHGLLGQDGHVIHGEPALLERHGGVLQEHLFELYGGHRGILGTVRDQSPHDRLDDIHERKQQDDHEQTHHRIDGRQVEGVHDGLDKRKMEDRVGDVKERCSDGGTDGGRDGIYHGDTLAVGVGSEGRQHDGRRGADRDTQQQGEGLFKLHGACHGQGLDDTDRRGGGLQEGCKEGADQDAQQRVGHGSERSGEPGLVAQTADGAAHGAHAEHQDDKAHQDVTDVLGGLFFAHHAEQDADDRDDAGQGLGREKLGESARRVDVAQTDDPAGDAGAQDGAQDDTDPLGDLHHARADETDDHDRGR